MQLSGNSCLAFLFSMALLAHSAEWCARTRLTPFLMDFLTVTLPNSQSLLWRPPKEVLRSGRPVQGLTRGPLVLLMLELLLLESADEAEQLVRLV